jgi:hypothetical protein
MSNFEVFTTATPERATTIVAEIAHNCGWNTYPPGSYYPHRPIKVLLILSLGREDALRMLFVGYTDVSERGGIEISIYPHPSTNIEALGTPYECLVGRLRQRLAPQLPTVPVQADLSTVKTRLASAAPDMPTKVETTKRGPRRANDDKRKTVEAYLKVKDDVKQEDFCRNWNVSERQLRRWIAKYKEDTL